MILGIGPAYARNLVQAFGEAVFDVVEHESDRLHEVTGIGRSGQAVVGAVAAARLHAAPTYGQAKSV